MTRFNGPLAVLLLVVGTNALAQEQTPHGALAERVDALRRGWSFGNSDDATPPVPQAAQAQASDAPKANMASPKPFPRVNPSDLLPRRWFGATPAATATDEVTPVEPETTPATPLTTQGAAGSARARLLRDLRQKTSAGDVDAPVAQLARRPQPRAGSVLSPGATTPTTVPVNSSATNTRLARSIAADVARAMDESTGAVAQPVAEPTPEATAETIVTPEVESAPIVAEASSRHEEVVAEGADEAAFEDMPGAEQIVDVDVAEIDAAAIKVTPSSDTTTLPLYIGDRYSTFEESADDEETSLAAQAFAEGPSAVEPAPPVQAVAPEDDLLLTQRMPVLVSKVSGPRTIIVGREATYRVLLANRGDTGADRVETQVTVPEWAEVVSVDTAAGSVDRSGRPGEPGTLVWRTNHLAKDEMVKLDVVLVARSGRPIQLGVTHTHQPVDGSTLVEVQEPKLSLSLIGPNEVLYGKPQLFRLTLANPGTGPAEQVTLYLTPPGGDAERQTSHDFGTIPAGEERSVEIELTAREAGQLAVAASAVADGDVSDDVTKEVFCRKAELVVDWRGPADRYAGAAASYYFRVRNPGTAVAPDVVLSVDLPEGFEVVPGAETPQPVAGRMAYRVGSLRPGDDRYFELRGVMRKAGPNQIGLRAAASDETRSDRVTATTDVVALADLKLHVLRPEGPGRHGRRDRLHDPRRKPRLERSPRRADPRPVLARHRAAPRRGRPGIDPRRPRRLREDRPPRRRRGASADDPRASLRRRNAPVPRRSALSRPRHQARRRGDDPVLQGRLDRRRQRQVGLQLPLAD